MSFISLLAVFTLATTAGYIIIRQVPSLLHTPLMSGMNALSGITVLGAIGAVLVASTGTERLLSDLALILAMINVIGGFAVTDRMLAMFKSGSQGESE